MEKKRGQGMVEYAMILGLIGVFCISTLSLLGDNVTNVFDILNNVKWHKGIIVTEYKWGSNFLGFALPEDYEAELENIIVYIEDQNGTKIELNKGGNFACPSGAYCPSSNGHNMSELVANGATIIVESNGTKVMERLVWDFN